jgi:dienelactone hydrolase
MARAEIATKPVVYRIQETESVAVQRDVRYDASNAGLMMDIYRPPQSATAPALLPAVIFVLGYSDLGAEKMLGCKFKDMQSYIDWAKLVAASGMIAITYVNHDPMGDLNALFHYLQQNSLALGVDANRIGLWSASGNVPRALDLLMQNHPATKCAALCYGVMLDLDGSSDVAESAKQRYFVNPTAGKTVTDLPKDVPLFIARAGRDTPQMNGGIDRFVAHALAANLPVTLANHSSGQHAFDLLEDSEASREIIRQILAFLRHFTQS